MIAEVTVIVPIYNVEKYISKCLDSLLSQTFRDIEIWAVDDGSPDNSKEIVKEYAKKDKRVKLIVKENGGYGSVLEYSINSVQTPYFIICDPDDWLKSDAIEKLYSFANQKDLDLVVGDKYNVYMENNAKEYICVVPSFIKIEPKKVYKSIEDIEKFSFLQVSPHAKLYKTNIVKNVVFPKHVSYTDFLLYVVALSRAKNIAYYNEALAYYLTNRPGNTRTDRRPSIIDDYTKVWYATLSYILEAQKTRNVDYLLERMYVQLRFIMKEYAASSKDLFHDKYFEELCAVAQCLSKYKKDIYRTYSGPIKGKILMHGIFNNLTSKCFIKLFVKKEYRK
ncbi:glycosyltransferase involved in cell wall biosynthesis [Lactobacillus colini]|uniref:Glycosyltransferase involved in cell wall biosynthesis n=1 Tax=Lactobacillus colini TaxID=1819254 RepID=A0ABS4MEJ3_9LACO|nr:glycosyltransferase family 2 protein [Lactobacillus colini]MBP2058105.1 glycosyltransferase involved in cell wall biosynthesis [Lactobacillus colini]